MFFPVERFTFLTQKCVFTTGARFIFNWESVITTGGNRHAFLVSGGVPSVGAALRPTNLASKVVLIVSSPANTQLDVKGFNSERRKFHPWLDIATSWYQCKRTSFKLHLTKIWASKSNRNPKMRQRLKLRRWRRSAVSTNLHKLVGKRSGFKISGISIFIQSSSILASKSVGFRYSDRAKAFLLQNPWDFDIYQYFDAGSPNLASKYLRKTW